MLEKIENNEVKKDECIHLFWKAADVCITDTMTEEECKVQYIRVLEILKELSLIIRTIKSKVIFTEALADILYLYCHTYTYFTPTDDYKKFSGEEVCIRK